MSLSKRRYARTHRIVVAILWLVIGSATGALLYASMQLFLWAIGG